VTDTADTDVMRAEQMLARAAGDERPPQPGIELGGLQRPAECFGLSRIEHDIVLFVAAVAVNPRFRPLYDAPPRRPPWRPTAAALTTLLGEVMAALAPDAHLVRCGLVDVIGEGPFVSRVVKAADPVWPRLVGLPVRLGYPIVPRGMMRLAQLAIASSTRRD